METVITNRIMESEWDACEGILERVKHSCFGMHLLYRAEFLRLRSQMAYYDVPIILFSSMNSVLIAGGKDFVPADILQILTCLLAVLTGVIQALKNFFKVDENRENCLSTFKDLMRLFCDVSFMLDQPRVSRGVEPKKFCIDKGNEYQSIMNKALVLKDDKVQRNPIYEDTLPYHPAPSGLSSLFKRTKFMPTSIRDVAHQQHLRSSENVYDNETSSGDIP
jgi:hypothetical protein